LSGNFLEEDKLKDIFEYAIYMAKNSEERKENIINFMQKLINNFDFKVINLNKTIEEFKNILLKFSNLAQKD